MINIAYETGKYCDYMHRQLPDTVRVDGLPLDGLPAGRIVYAKTDVGHWPLVTDGIALPLALRALDLPRITLPVDLPLGLPLRCKSVVDTRIAAQAAADDAATIAAKIVLPPL
jgi:hypothetical protein